MDVKTYFDTKREMTKYCNKGECFSECKLAMMNNGMYVNCMVLEQDYPDKAEAIIQKYIDRKENNMTVNDLLKRIKKEDYDKVIVISDSTGWGNIKGKISINDSVIMLYSDENEIFTDE